MLNPDDTETGTRNRRTIRKRFLEETAVVGVYRVFDNPVSGIILDDRVCFTATRQAGGDGHQHHQEQLACGIAGFTNWKVGQFLFLLTDAVIY